MGDSKTKFEELEETQSNTGIGQFHQTTTQDLLEFELLEENFIKNEETLMRDLLEEFKTWNDEWDYCRNHGIEHPMDADQLAKELSKKYKISKI